MHSDRTDPLRPCWYGMVGALIGAAFCLFVAPAAAYAIARLLGWPE